MSYIEKTLSDGEKIISSSTFHWWYTTRIFVFSIFFILIGVIALSSSSLEQDSLSVFFGSVFIIFTPVVGLLYYIVALILKKTTEQVLTTKRIFLKTGLIRRDTDELLKEKVETISINQSFIGRILDFGDVEFTGTGGIKIKFVFVKNPTLVKKTYEQ